MIAPNNNQPDDVSFALQLLAAGGGLVVVSSFGPLAVLSATAPWVLVWLFGRSSAAIGVLLAGIACMASVVYANQLLPALLIGYQALFESTLPERAATSWLYLATRNEVLPSAIAVGLTLGAGARLLVQDRLEAWLNRGEHAAASPPMAQLRSRLTSSSPAAVRDGTILGTSADTGAPLVLSDHDANHHTIIVGASGVGKTVTGSNIIESHIERGIPVVFLDGKGDVVLGRSIKAFAERHNRPAFIFHHGGDGGNDDACAYNPLSSSDFTATANLLSTLRDYSEPHFEILQKGHLQTGMKTAQAVGEPIDLLTIGKLLSVNAMSAAVRRNKHRIHNAQELLDEIQDQRKAEEEGVESMTGLIKNLARSSLSSLFNTRSGRPVLTLPEARRGGGVVYFALPALVYPDLSKNLGQLIINDIRLTLASGKGPWLIVFDELATFAGRQILALVNQGRGFGARVVLLGQTFADLEAVSDMDGKTFRNQIIGSVSTVVVHRLNGPDDAEFAAQIGGTFLKPEVTAQTVGNQPTGAGSTRMTREFHVGPDRFKNLKRGEAIILSRLGSPIRKIRARLSSIMK